MSGGGTGQGALYSPLPQSISDTDSSEEELISVVHHDNRKLVVSSKESVEKRNGQKMGDYRPLGRENESDVAINGFPTRGPTSADDVPIIKSESSAARHLEPMSPLRRLFFVLSILLCGLTIVVFLWVLPCDWATCPSAPRKSNTGAWEQTLDGMELKGAISVVEGVRGRSHNLVFLMRGDALGTAPVDEGPDWVPSNGGGIVSLVGATGDVAWCLRLLGVPQDVDCTLLDVTRDGVQDCLVTGTDFLAAVDPLSGEKVWYLHKHKDDAWKALDIDFPLVLPDLDADGVNELVMACSIIRDSRPTFEHNYLVLVSGKRGMVIGEPVQIQNCSSVSALELLADLNISYTCQDITASGKASTVVQVSIQELYAKTTNTSLAPTTNLSKFKNRLKQHKPLSRLKADDPSGKNSHYDVGDHSLILENRGQCPLHCSTAVLVLDERANRTIVWNYTGENTYATVPATLEFDGHPGSTVKSPGSIAGFILKLWRWNDGSRHEPDENAELSTKPLFRSRLKRSVLSALKQSPKCSNVSVHELNERTMLVTFNATYIHIVNSSQSNITQLCAEDHSLCQPSLAFQDQSLLIADLDQDGSQELISYLSTYVSSGLGWKLQSTVRVIRLEAELMELYEAVVH